MNHAYSLTETPIIYSLSPDNLQFIVTSSVPRFAGTGEA